MGGGGGEDNQWVGAYVFISFFWLASLTCSVGVTRGTGYAHIYVGLGVFVDSSRICRDGYIYISSTLSFWQTRAREIYVIILQTRAMGFLVFFFRLRISKKEMCSSD